VRKRLGILCLVAVLGATVATVRPAIGAKRHKIVQLSHEHPEGESFSYFCGKLKGKPDKRYRVEAEGPAVTSGPVKFRMPKSGAKKVTFEIEAAGTYTMIMMNTSETRVYDEKSYDVPSPPPGGAAMGPFACS